MINEMGLFFFVCLSAISVTSVAKDLFKSCAHFLLAISLLLIAIVLCIFWIRIHCEYFLSLFLAS